VFGNSYAWKGLVRMNPVGLAISQADGKREGAYPHRIAMLRKCLEERSIPCDMLFMEDTPPLDIQTAASLFMPFFLRKLRKYDFIYCGAEPACQTLFFCKKFLRGKVILDVHGDEIAQSRMMSEAKSGGRKHTVSPRVVMINRMSMAIADHFLTVAKPQTDTFLREGIPAERISLIRNGVDLKQFVALPQPKEPAFTFGYVGDFQVWQAIPNLIAALEKFDNPDVRMLLVGFRESDRPLKETFRRKFGSRVELVDRVPRDQMIELIKSVGILMIPRIAHQALLHAFPTKFGEYAALGRPIMVNDIDETADFVRRYQCGFVSDPSPEAMAKAMAEAAQVPAGTLAEMGARARHMAEENFSWDTIGDEYAALIRRLTGKP
jgi:glycosyltransferase involved in cell wall biosynthesis